MGCDITMYVERKGHDGKWHNCDYFVQSISSPGKYNRIPLFDDRSYALFATLADVRNYGNTDYICKPKGFPDDASEYVRAEYEDYGIYDHSHSYLTLQELIDFQNEKHPLKRRGMLDPEALKQFDEHGILPDTYCQDTNCPGYEFREWEEDIDILAPIVDELKKRADELDIIWKFAWDAKNEDMRQNAYDAAADVRTVFWFDN